MFTQEQESDSLPIENDPVGIENDPIVCFYLLLFVWLQMVILDN